MARCPFAEWVPIALTENQKRRKIKPVGLVCHTAVSNSSLLRPTGEVRWHFYLNKAGKLYQFFDTGTYAPCQYDGNYWTIDGEGRGFISCESWDGAGSVWDGRDVSKLPPWNGDQLETWAKLGAWLHEEHGVDLVKATGARGKGIGFHAQFTNTSPYKWNTNHACPGPKRIAQMPDVIAAMRAAANQEDDMPITDADAAKIAAKVWDYGIDPGPVAEREGGYEPGNNPLPARGFLVGGDLGMRLLQRFIKAEEGRDAAEALATSALSAAVASLEWPLTQEELDKLAKAFVRELVGEVTQPDGA